ncbi:MAG TPA: preprotein translocase subunit YajC [Methylomusa anaerophila]|uniref:Preprotein translocase subunit YajC n=1 Tax=Methylomusa anaerophila TaxID=1930071 RepID=A0A348AP68_9FIRM|nr:preprotein translocase subunit YajC [Methylomusa anaerophila]BBB92866.1 preprotein translocase subunit YajC [Methylomusa anaerophila]HML87298.1 preprotein translocase subunit YajC [Methylomusa anaerophila]
MPEFSPEVLQMLQASWPIVLMGVIFYFLLYRPQKKEQQRRQEMLSNLKKGDRIVTIGGVHGTITALTDKVVTVKIADKVEIVVSRSAVSHYQNQDKNT